MSLGKKKAQVVSRELAKLLSVRFAAASLLVREGTDASGNPQMNIDDGTPATTEQAVYLRIIEQPSIGLNSIGQTQDSFGPHTIQIVLEATAASAAVSLLTDVNKVRLLGEVFRLGTKVEVYVRAAGGVPVVGDITAGNLVATFQDLYNPLTNEV